jgi:uncharacterized protein with beta-barrel porin domain
LEVPAAIVLVVTLKVPGMRELVIRLFARGDLDRRRAVVAAARSLAAAIAILLLAGEAAWADCTPAAANNVTATCTGTTTNQGGGAPGTSASADGTGYGTGVETGVTVNVAGGATNTVTGTNNGIVLGDATVINNAGASIGGAVFGIVAFTGFANVTNAGSIKGNIGNGISAGTNATVTNNAGASIAGGSDGIVAFTGFANVTNSGSITSIVSDGISAGTDATVINNGAASIAGGFDGIATGGFANVTNSGSIAGTNGFGISAGTDATVTNNAGASIAGGFDGIHANTGFANVTNSGSITGTTGSGIFAETNATVTNNAGASITGGPVGITALGGGSSVFNGGTISGGIAIQFSGSGNTLTLAQGSLITGAVLGTGSDIFQLGGTGAATFDVSSLGPAAQYRGFGTFNKIGTSTWTLTGTNTSAIPWTISAGRLNVDGTIANSTMTVNAGGTLGGSGTVGSTAVTDGTLAPGSAASSVFGPLAVQGNLSFTAASTYMIQVSPADAGRTNVLGTATLGGATVNASFAAGTFVAKQYTILHATGGVTGTFGSQVNTNLPAGFKSSLSYDGNDAYLNLALSFIPPSSPNFGGGLNGNQARVGAALVNFFNSTGGIPMVFGSLSPAGLTQASGETATGSQQTTFDAMNQFMGVMTDPFVAGRGDGVTSGVGAPTGYASTQTTGATRDAYAMFTKAPPAAFEQRWSVWAAGYGGSQTTDGNAALGSNSTTSSIAGTVVGADYRISPNTLAGFALAGGGTSFSVAGSGSGHSDLFQAGAFIRHTVGPAYISAALAYGWQDITTNRTVTAAGIDQLRAEFNANAFSGRLEGGYRFVSPWAGGIGITPYAAAQFTTFDLPAYAEQATVGSNAFALAYNAKDVTDTRSELGIRTDKSWAMQGAILTLRSRFAWAHDFDPDRSIAATFQTLPGASFTVNGAAQAHDSALTTASVEMKWTNGWSAAATFEGEFSNVTSSYAGKGVVRYAW